LITPFLILAQTSFIEIDSMAAPCIHLMAVEKQPDCLQRDNANCKQANRSEQVIRRMN